jgi:hypothetical protein
MYIEGISEVLVISAIVLYQSPKSYLEQSGVGWSGLVYTRTEYTNLLSFQD